MNKEVHYEGWLIKSPPTKRIWRARWRRRWFTLKQGEIPEQFCLEYYTDRNCRKLKGVIDLDQCEQVDCGLRLENRKQKFQFMFDIKTPRRTYYLAADTEADMRDWVNCICQVCHLHDTKQSSDLPEENQTQSTVSTGLASASISSSSVSTSKTINTTTTSLNVTDPGAGSATRQSINAPDILRRPAVNAIEQQPQSSRTTIASSLQSNDASAYVNTEYTNRETMLCETRLDGSQGGNGTTATAAAASATAAAAPARPTAPSSSPASPRTEAAASGAAVYLNSSIFNRPDSTGRLAVSSSGIVRKIPENLVLNNTPLIDTQQSSVQPSPALSTASGPYIPISECFSGSPKILLDGNKPTTPLSHFDPKFYDTPRSHSNIVLNLNKDQSHSPRITNIGGLQQPTPAKSRSGRSDSDSESVFTDDEEWAHPMPLRENIDRSTRPSDSSVENESFVFTYSQRFSKLPEDISKEQENSANTAAAAADDSSDKLNEALKNENISILDIKENEKTPKEQRQRTDAENSSPAIGPGDAKSVVDESYDIPRSHNLPYCNMGQLFEKGATSPEVDPIASSTPNLIVGLENISPHSPSNIRTLPRPHCYTNAAPSKVEGNVFSYDFMEQVDLPPVNRSLKPKVSLEDKPPEEVPAKPPIQQSILKQNLTPSSVDGLANKLMTTNIQSSGAISKGISATITPTTSAGVTTTAVTTKTTPSANANAPLNPPSVDRKLKPNAYKFGNSATMGPSTRRSTGAPLSMVFNTDNEGGYIMQTRTLPRHPRPSNFTLPTAGLTHSAGIHSAGLSQQQRAAFAAATFQMAQSPFGTVLLFPKNEHKLQYFDLDVSNPPPMIHRQSMSVGNLNAPAGGSRFALSADPSARAPVKSGVVYNSVDFVKTEAFKLVREERIRETEVINNLHK